MPYTGTWQTQRGGYGQGRVLETVTDVIQDQGLGMRCIFFGGGGKVCA